MLQKERSLIFLEIPQEIKAVLEKV